MTVESSSSKMIIMASLHDRVTLVKIDRSLDIDLTSPAYMKYFSFLPQFVDGEVGAAGTFSLLSAQCPLIVDANGWLNF